VPIWAGVMKAATKGAKAAWIERPSTVVGVNVCRISGQLPNHGCGKVDVVMDDGRLESRSMVYTDFFVRGTQPTTVCPLHGAPSFMERLAGVFGRDSDQAVSATEIGVPLPPPTSTSGRAAKAEDDDRRAAEAKNDTRNDEKAGKEEEPKKKRGFWSRLFGRGGEDEKKKQEDEKKKQEEERKRNQRKPGGGGTL
jgi:hypothetical protein